jgi:hypothetical protein
VRRHAGSEEIAIHRKRMESSAPHADALILDDNTFPKQIWSFIFRGRKFANFGPLNYSLAHIFDHKIYKNRAVLEFDNNTTTMGTLFGLYTSVGGTVYMPNGLMRPTDFSNSLRNLIQRQAQFLYGDFCNLLPPPQSIKTDFAAGWALENFRWRHPVGTIQHIDTFLTYRNEMMERLFFEAEANSIKPGP